MIYNQIHRKILFVVFAPTCFGLESRSSSGSYEPFRRIQRIWQLTYTYKIEILRHRCYLSVYSPIRYGLDGPVIDTSSFSRNKAAETWR